MEMWKISRKLERVHCPHVTSNLIKSLASSMCSVHTWGNLQWSQELNLRGEAPVMNQLVQPVAHEQ